MMWKRLVLIFGGVVLLAGSFFAGYAIGARRNFFWMLDVQETEVRGSLHSLVETLASIRTGDTEEVIGLLESRAEAAVTTLPQSREWDEIPPGTRHSLLVAKKYFEAFPPREPGDEFLATLSWIPDEPLDPDSSSPLLRQLQEGPADNQAGEAAGDD